MNTENLNYTIRFARESENKPISELSKKFSEENCCNGIIADNEDYFKNLDVAVILVDNTIIGYGYGTFETNKKDTTFTKKDELNFVLEEIYICKEYRNCNLGKNLFKFLTDYAKKQGCKTVQTFAVSKNYKALLHFYIDELKMEFWSANLIKKL